MNLIFLRHGKAEDNHPDGDFSRALSSKKAASRPAAPPSC